jgi:hypothetical protein
MRLISMAMKIAVLAVLSASTASAGGVVTGTVTQVVVRASDGLVYVMISGTPTGKPWDLHPLGGR